MPAEEGTREFPSSSPTNTVLGATESEAPKNNRKKNILATRIVMVIDDLLFYLLRIHGFIIVLVSKCQCLPDLPQLEEQLE